MDLDDLIHALELEERDTHNDKLLNKDIFSKGKIQKAKSNIDRIEMEIVNDKKKFVKQKLKKVNPKRSQSVVKKKNKISRKRSQSETDLGQ